MSKEKETEGRSPNPTREAFDDLQLQHDKMLNTCREFVKPLSSVLKYDGVDEASFEESIFTRTQIGMVFHAPLALPKSMTKKDLGAKTRAVGVFGNSVPLSASGAWLKPGTYVVRLRPLLWGRRFAFDFVDRDNNVVLSTDATPTVPGGYNDLPEDTKALKINLGFINASIGGRFCVDAISGGGFPVPPGSPGPTFPPDEGFCAQEVCVSFLIWKACLTLTNYFK